MKFIQNYLRRTLIKIKKKVKIKRKSIVKNDTEKAIDTFKYENKEILNPLEIVKKSLFLLMLLKNKFIYIYI